MEERPTEGSVRSPVNGCATLHPSLDIEADIKRKDPFGREEWPVVEFLVFLKSTNDVPH